MMLPIRTMCSGTIGDAVCVTDFFNLDWRHSAACHTAQYRDCATLYLYSDCMHAVIVVFLDQIDARQETASHTRAQASGCSHTYWHMCTSTVLASTHPRHVRARCQSKTDATPLSAIPFCEFCLL